ncbi:zinc-dependent alcohol dehydrogenase family protein [Limibacillus halophilus]|uniref:Alcohol dehydrogenase n=1 Tax=Limibacillus halophilus TaxID=1579333 RepID=A0A839STB1_9PROT|nr:zinc-dependent alcohol dehydrogenase family protein [Limibacillus halophilus]MBB3064950.1 alcohol dehydrogenase [Limibacillus halophilus]
MKAALFEAFRGPLHVQTVPDPDCPLDGVVVSVEACGVCRSDWHGWTGADPDVQAPHVPGHEFAGRIVEVGPECRNFSLGDRVTAPFILACGQCPVCRAGDPTICADQFVLGFSGWGAFAQLAAVPHADFNLVTLPETMSFDEAAAMGCRFTTAYRGLVERATLKPGEWLVVHGCGGIGLSAVMIGAAMGASVLAVDIDDAKLALAQDLGATLLLNARTADSVGESVRDMTGGGGHVSVDALGVTETFNNSLYGLRRLGRHVQIGMPTDQHARPTLALLDLVYSRQLTLLGTRGMAAHRFPSLLDMVTAGRVSPGRLVTNRISLAQAGKALSEMDDFKGSGITVITDFNN